MTDLPSATSLSCVTCASASPCGFPVCCATKTGSSQFDSYVLASETVCKADCVKVNNQDSLSCSALTSRQQHACRQLANSALARILETYLEYKTLAHQFGVFHAPWKKVATSHGITCYSRPSLTAKTTLATCSTMMGQMEGHYRDFVQFCQTNDRDRVLQVQKLFYGSVVDAAQLHRIPLGREQDPSCSLTVRWSAFDFSSPRLRFDCCQLEYLGFATDEKGREIGFRIVLPIELDNCPAGFYSARFVRASVAHSLLIIPSREDTECSDIFALTEDDFGLCPVPSRYYKAMMSNLARIGRQCCHSKYISQPEMNKANWIPNEQRKECSICERGFNAFRHRHHCRLCGEIVCFKCLVMMADAKEASQLVRKKKKVCLTCISSVRQDCNDSFLARQRVLDDRSDTESFASTNRFEFDHAGTILSSPSTASGLDDSATSDPSPNTNDRREQQQQLELRSMPLLRTPSPSGPSDDEIILNIDTQDMLPARFLCQSDPSSNFTFVSHGSSNQSVSSLESIESAKLVMDKIDESIAEQEKLLVRLRGRIRTL